MGQPERVVDRLKEAYPGHYQVSENLYLIRTGDLARAVAENLGIRSNAVSPGIVMKLNRSYSGFFNSDIWDWLGDE